MKRIKLTVMCFAALLCGINAMGQGMTMSSDGSDRGRTGTERTNGRVDQRELHEKMLNEKYEFFRRELRLDEVQMQRFWEMYKMYDAQIFECHEQSRREASKIAGIDLESEREFNEENLSQEAAVQLMDQKQKEEQQLFTIEMKFTRSFMEVLPPQKVLKLKRLEKQFMREVFSGKDRQPRHDREARRTDREPRR